MVFIAGALWGTIGPLMTVMSDAGASAAEISLVRVVFAFLIMVPITLVRSGSGALRISGRALVACALLGIVCHGIYNVFYAYAVTACGVATAAVLLNVAPIFGLLFAVLLFKEAPTGLKILAMIGDALGCMLVVNGGDFSSFGGSGFGVLCGIGAGLTYALTAVFGRIAGNRTDAFVMSTYSYLFASLFMIVWEQPWSASMSINGTVLIAGFALALVPTAIAYVIYYEGVTRIRENSKVPVVASIETVVAAAFGILLYHESIGPAGIGGIVLVLASIALMSLRPNNPGKPARIKR
jgi:DME family drug/metabolite transporter